MIDYYKELGLNKEASSQKLCEELNERKQKILVEQKSVGGLLSESGKKMVDLIDEAVEVFSDPFKLAEYNSKLLESEMVEKSVPIDVNMENIDAASPTPEPVDVIDTVPKPSRAISPEEQAAWENKENDLNSELYLLNKYSSSGDGDVSQLDLKQTQYIYQRCVLRSAQYGASWAEYATSKGNTFIQQIISSKSSSQTSSVKDIKEKLSKADLPKVDIPKIDLSKVEGAKQQVSKINKRPLIIGAIVLLAVIVAVVAIHSGKTEDNSSGVPGIINDDPYAGKAVALSTLTPSNSDEIYYSSTEGDSEGIAENDSTYLDTFGNNHTNAVVLESGSYYDNPTTITYDLDDDYPRFTANLSTRDDSYGSYYLWIYTNGKEDEPIYEANLDRTSAPSTIDLDINGASSLSIAILKDDSSDNCNLIISSGYLYIDPSIENISSNEIGETEIGDNVSLGTFKMIDYEDAEMPKESVPDTLGNELSADLVLSSSSYGTDMPFATYYLDKKYSRLTANVSTGDNTYGSYTLKVFADKDFDNPIKELNMQRSVEVQNIDLDVSGKEYLTFAITKEDSSDYAEAIIFGSYLYAVSTGENLSLSSIPKYDNVESTKITSMKMTNYSDASDETTVDDISGNTQTHSMLLDLSSYSNEEAYATYYTHKDYKSFTADLYNYADTSGSYDFVIYGDLNPDKELFSTKRSADSGKESVSANISDCTFVTIMITKHENDEHTGAILTDAYFNVD